MEEGALGKVTPTFKWKNNRNKNRNNNHKWRTKWIHYDEKIIKVTITTRKRGIEMKENVMCDRNWRWVGCRRCHGTELNRNHIDVPRRYLWIDKITHNPSSHRQLQSDEPMRDACRYRVSEARGKNIIFGNWKDLIEWKKINLLVKFSLRFLLLASK